MRLCRVFAAVLLTVFLWGCAPMPNAPAEYAPREDNRLVIYTSHKEEVYLPVIREFEERTGIWVQVVTGGTNELLSRIQSEQDAPQADVMFGGGVESLAYYQDCFTPYASGELDHIVDSFRAENDIWTPFSALPVVLIYNTKLVGPYQLQSWEDLNRPAFRGKIAFADPAISGSSFTALATRLLVGGKVYQDTMAQLARSLQYTQLGSSGAVLTAVESGSFLVGITLEETAMKHIAAGADMAIVYPTDGTSCVPDGTALVKDAPHKDNAQKFIDFTISFDVQQMLSSTSYRRSVRTDVAVEPPLLPISDIALIEYDIAWVYTNRETILSQWAALQQEGSR